VQIADAIRGAIIDGQLLVDARLPSETELATHYGVSRPTVREALKRLAAQSLIRTQRGASGGAFVNRMTFEEAHGHMITTSTLLLSMNDIDFATAAEARFALERACLPLACARRDPVDLAQMRLEIDRQADATLTDDTFCASDVAFHRALVDCAGNPVLSYHLAGAVEAMQPLMNMITFTTRSRARILSLHIRLANAVERSDLPNSEEALTDLATYTAALGADALASKISATLTMD
jgi:GntR family transcriptional repressor for pyruvate dehydrogenase complex